MRIIKTETKAYTFDELSDDAKENAINEFRKDGIDMQYAYDDAYESVKEFHKIFPTREGGRNWLDVRTSHIDDNILELSGLRLQKYIWNNYKKELYSGKLFYKGGVSVKTRFRKSNCQITHSCELTGGVL